LQQPFIIKAAFPVIEVRLQLITNPGFDQCRSPESIEKYDGDVRIRHERDDSDSKEAFIRDFAGTIFVTLSRAAIRP